MNPHWNLQVVIGDGRSDTGAHHRAIDVAAQLLVADKWPDHETTRLVVHNPYDVHRRLQLSGQPTYNSQVNASVYPGVQDLVAGQDYEIKPLPADFWRMHQLSEPNGGQV